MILEEAVHAPSSSLEELLDYCFFFWCENVGLTVTSSYCQFLHDFDSIKRLEKNTEEKIPN